MLKLNTFFAVYTILIFVLGSCGDTVDKIEYLQQLYQDEFEITNLDVNTCNNIVQTTIVFKNTTVQVFSDGTKFNQEVTYTIFNSDNNQQLDSLFDVHNNCSNVFCLKADQYIVQMNLGPDNSRYAISMNYDILCEVFPEKSTDRIYFCDRVLQNKHSK